MQVTKGTWRMREQCVPGSLSSSPAQEPGNEATTKRTSKSPATLPSSKSPSTVTTTESTTKVTQDITQSRKYDSSSTGAAVVGGAHKGQATSKEMKTTRKKKSLI